MVDFFIFALDKNSNINTVQIDHLLEATSRITIKDSNREHTPLSVEITVEPLLTQTVRWTAQTMGYERLWVF